MPIMYINTMLLRFTKKPKDPPQLGVKRSSELVAKAFSPDEEVNMFSLKGEVHTCLFIQFHICSLLLYFDLVCTKYGFRHQFT